MSSPKSHNSESSEETVLNPFNPVNKVITDDIIYKILTKFGVTGITKKDIDIDIFIKSLLHKSYTFRSNYELSRCKEEKYSLVEKPNNCLDFFEGDSYEKLEFLGDRVLELVVVNYIYTRYVDTDEGFMTKLKTRIVATNSLAQFAKHIGLDEYLIISRHVEDNGEGRTNKRILEDIFEAFIGAMFLNFGNNDMKFNGYHFGICETFIQNVIEQVVDFEDLIMNDDNYKDILLRYFQHNFKITPKYIQLESNGPSHSRQFIMGVLDKDGNIIGKGIEKSKKKAEQEASRRALIYFGELE
tara:strand:- start:2188 stop:3084 length:897 start_codon:yes stop_codon:yes gene_type:complete